MGNVAKLPKWAQAQIRSLEHQVSVLEARRLENENPDTNVFLKDYFSDTDIPLPRDSRIMFRNKEQTMQVAITEDHLEVYSNRNGMTIRPWVTNVVHIYPFKD